MKIRTWRQHCMKASPATGLLTGRHNVRNGSFAGKFGEPLSSAHDKRGNRAVIAAGSYIPLPIYTPQIPTAGSAMPYSGNFWTGGSYDQTGNETAIVGGVYNFFYDAENRQRRAVQSGTPAVTTDYTYDGDGKRITRTTGSAVTTFVYDAAGNVAVEYGPGAPPACQVSSPFVRATCFLTTDHLGSVRMVTDAAGTVISRHDYLPFGEEIPASVGNRSAVPGYGVGDGVPERFTGKERDGETGPDYFGARYLSAAQGRFTSPDVINLTDDRLLMPSSTINKYVYGGNNPLKYIDPDRTSRHL
ncbi:MAG: RHS repeat-associated core domain-containing protein [Bryobacteraceae bacterium]